jgi:ferric-dicitrate binding protein FerR (iron transport regulator)
MEQPYSYFEIAELISKFLTGDLSPDELIKLEAWASENERHAKIWKRLTDPDYIEKRLLYLKDSDPAVDWERLRTEISGRRPVFRMFLASSMKYAAILLPILLLCGFWLYFARHRTEELSSGNTAGLANVHILPRGNVAKLVLGNGRTVALNDSLEESITEKDGTQVRNHGGSLSYVASAKAGGSDALYNTLLIPRGGTYQLTLSDGTKIWLNAASSLRYPIRFTGNERKVYLLGEAYFEVAKDQRHPFIVVAGKTRITVLGTKFDVNSYSDNPRQKITLAEGSVRVKSADSREAGKGVLLQPGYEALIKSNENDIVVKKADVELALAWQRGMFIFNGETLGNLMRELSRWYNVNVVYDDGVDTLFHFTGRIKRRENITAILRLLELTGMVKFDVKGYQVEVKPVLPGV